MLLIPTVFKHGKSRVFCFLYQFRTMQTFTQIHDKPHRFNRVTGSNLATLKTIHKITVYIYIFDNDSTKFGTIKDVHNFMDASVHSSFQVVFT